MKRTDFIVLILVVFMLCLCFVALTACNKVNDCNKKGHKFNNDGVCSVCGYFETGFKFQMNDDCESWSIVGAGTFTGTDLVIPSANYDGKPVTNIAEFAFSECENLTNITIPDSIVTIGGGAFHDTPWYEKQPDGVIYIGKILYGYKGDMPESTSIAVKDGTISISSKAFSERVNLTSITMPNSVTDIGYYAFLECVNLTNITISNNITSIDYGAFDSTLWYDNQPEGIIYIGKTLYSYKGDMPENTSITIKDGTTSISSYAFSGCDNLTSITMPNSVTNIGYSAFSDCENLASIKISKNIKSIGTCAFYSCGSLTDITIPESIVSVGELAFHDTPWYENQSSGIMYFGKTLYSYKGEMPANTSIDVKDGTVIISSYAFQNCAGLTNINIPESVTSIGAGAFRECTTLTSITIPDGITNIGAATFSECSSLTNIVIPNSVISIGLAAFQRCESLTNITIPEGVTSIGSYTFNMCNSLTNINIPNSVTNIEDGAFQGCESLTNITIPDSVSSIGSAAFKGCESLTNITIPDGVTSIGRDALHNTAWYNNQPDGAIYIGDILYSYKGDISANTHVIIKEGTVSINASAFYDCNNITSIEIPESLTNIGNNAFRECYTLIEVYNKSPLTITAGSSDNGYIGFYAKSIYTEPYTSKISTDSNGYLIYTDGDEKLLIGYTGNETSLVIPSGITTIGYGIFSECDNLTGLKLPEGLKTINGAAFKNCNNIEELVLPDSIISIEDEAFYGCSGLKYISAPSTVQNIGLNAFHGCSSFTKIVGPTNFILSIVRENNNEQNYEVIINGGTTIDGHGFYRCTGMTSISLPDGLISISGQAFSGCTGLTTITLPDGLISISGQAFSGCTGLTTITLPDSLVNIDGRAFYGCTGLTNITIPENTSVDGWAFYGCTSLETVTISKNAKVGGWCFWECINLKTINYDGTIWKWKQYNDRHIPTGCTIYCTDGTITGDGTITYYDDKQ